MINADVVIGHIGDKPVGLASWIFLIWLGIILFGALAAWLSN